MDCTGSATIRRLVSALAGLAVASNFAVPGAIAVTRPDGSTFAIVGVLDFHTMGTSVRGSPFEERAVAARIVEPPTASACETGATSSFATGGVTTVTCAIPGLSSVTMPGAWKTTTPLSSAPATSNGAANQTSGFTSITLPEASFATAVNCTL